jgi:hypothetical protein
MDEHEMFVTELVLCHEKTPRNTKNRSYLYSMDDKFVHYRYLISLG